MPKPGNPLIPKNKMTEVKSELSNIDWNNEIKSNDLENSCNSLMKIRKNLTGKYTKMFKGMQQKVSLPWLNKDIHQLMKKRVNALKKASQQYN